MGYRDHHTFFGKIFGWFGDWIHDLVSGSNKDLLEIAIKITEGVKDFLNSGIVDAATAIIPTTIDDKIVAFLRPKLDLILADELALQTLNEASSPEDTQAVMQKILDSFGGLSDEKKQEFYTSVAARVYQFILEHQGGKKVTFGEAASLVEYCYQAFLNSKKD